VTRAHRSKRAEPQDGRAWARKRDAEAANPRRRRRTPTMSRADRDFYAKAMRNESNNRNKGSAPMGRLATGRLRKQPQNHSQGSAARPRGA